MVTPGRKAYKVPTTDQYEQIDDDRKHCIMVSNSGPVNSPNNSHCLEILFLGRPIPRVDLRSSPATPAVPATVLPHPAGRDGDVYVRDRSDLDSGRFRPVLATVTRMAEARARIRYIFACFTCRGIEFGLELDTIKGMVKVLTS
jgi:hypothetical protein